VSLLLDGALHRALHGRLYRSLHGRLNRAVRLDVRLFVLIPLDRPLHGTLHWTLDWAVCLDFLVLWAVLVRHLWLLLSGALRAVSVLQDRA
jgi:hypothetical protein